PARISFRASVQNGVLLAISAPTCSTYSCQLFSISSLNSCGSVPSRSPCWRFSGWYTTRSDTSARARRRAFCFGSCTMNGFTGRSGLVMRCPGAAPAGAAGAAGARGAAGAGDAAAGVAGRAGGGAGGRDAAAGIPGGGAAGESEGAAGPAGAAGARWAAATAGPAAPTPALTGNTLLHTAQRARTPPGGTLAGSTRYTVSHDG